ncbi:hypothetical protein RUM4293_02573 [Ruegeria atlantica]|uniref:Uncharacterized protein n=2 Tax=Ruegeria atlantica TaxID=81569 RepID=A0A0P1EN18_9RHOB|nr:hypothetical protein RUM4293_02573 [Ruegeria atlantica]
MFNFCLVHPATDKPGFDRHGLEKVTKFEEITSRLNARWVSYPERPCLADISFFGIAFSHSANVSDEPKAVISLEISLVGAEND